jgi:hypothetical protein
VFTDYVHDFLCFFLVVDLLERDAVLPCLGLGVYLVYPKVDLNAQFSDLGYYLGFLLFYLWGN